MTAIVAIAHGRRVTLAAESAISQGAEHPLAYTSDPKVWVQGREVIGVCGNADADAIASTLDWSGDLRKAAGEFARATRRAEGGTSVLIGRRGKIYAYSGGAIWTVRESYAAIGSAEAYLLGVLDGWASRRKLAPGDARVAVRLACRRFGDCGGRLVSVSA